MLTQRLQPAFPGWTFGQGAEVVIEVMVRRERDRGEAWTGVTTWGGLRRLDAGGGCEAGMRSERTDDLEQALSAIVRLMATGQEIPAGRR